MAINICIVGVDGRVMIKHESKLRDQGLTRACPSHNAQLLSSSDQEIEFVQDNGCILPVPHLIALKGDASTLWPVLWDFSLLYVSGGLGLTTLLSKKRRN